MKRNRNTEEIKGINIADDPDIQITYPDDRDSHSFWLEARSLARDLFFAGVIAVLIIFFVVRPVKVEGTSMLPRLENDERIFVDEFSYNFSVAEIRRGDIVVFWYPQDPSKSFIKRVIGLPGERVRIDERGQVFIKRPDGISEEKLEESYLSAERNTSRNPFSSKDVIKPHHYFVMGDNRDASNDSRAWGEVPVKYIYGKAMFRYWPLERIGFLSE